MRTPNPTPESVLETDQLDVNERARLVQVKSAIERGFQKFCGYVAIAKSGDRKLYRETQTTFEAYSRHKWGTAKHTARLAAARGCLDGRNKAIAPATRKYDR